MKVGQAVWPALILLTRIYRKTKVGVYNTWIMLRTIKARLSLLYLLAIIGVCRAQSGDLPKLPQPAAEPEATSARSAPVPRTLETYPWSLQYAATHHQLSVISMLIKMGVDVNAQGSEGNRALDVACLQGDAATSRLLLDHGADPNLRNKSGSTPLHDAALNGNKEVIELLLAHKASINEIASADGSTPLQYAASMDRLEAAQTLVQHGADVMLKNAKGLTAIQLAEKNNFADISEFLSHIVSSQR